MAHSYCNELTPERSAKQIMLEFSGSTGLRPAAATPRRYLWTDAFAVCNFMELYAQTSDEKFQRLALDLVEQVHRVLGQFREDDPRDGWISHLDTHEGGLHPTAGGLRIGKRLPERRREERFDERLEWDRDGQYFHYLTKWMHALNRVGAVTGQTHFHRWALELVRAAHAAFFYVPPGSPVGRMHWKMSTDLSYPLVPSMGHHDPLDGLITFQALQASAAACSDDALPDLGTEISDLAKICSGMDWATDDVLGLGGLLSDACRITQLMAKGVPDLAGLLSGVLDASSSGLRFLTAGDSLHYPVEHRLAFRELGLSIGLQGVGKMQGALDRNPDAFRDLTSLGDSLHTLATFASVGRHIEAFWRQPVNQAAGSWVSHRDINAVMLATSLAPDTFLKI
jgi:hypothetical protein